MVATYRARDQKKNCGQLVVITVSHSAKLMSMLGRDHQDLNVNAKLPDARRSTRTKTVSGHDILREPYMMLEQSPSHELVVNTI